MEAEKITLRERDDLGPVLARADHQENVIEVNKKAFYGLPPMVQEFVLCHEVCHLKHDEWDEERTNRMAADLFLNRSNGDADRKEREQFLSYLNDNGGYSNFAWSALIGAVLSLGTTAYGIIKNRNAGWYSWDDASKQANLKTMLTTAFEKARKSNSKSSADFFWEQISVYTNKDASLKQFMNRSSNAWVKPVISQYETAYGFGFEEVTPIDLTAFPLVIVAIGSLVAFVAYKIIKKYKK